MAKPTVTIVTPSYNQGRYLEHTIRSVLEQNYSGIEYIVMDGGSTDGSVEIIKKYASRLAYWTSQRDGGQTDAIIKGFARASGSILGWLNSDDMLAPSAVRLMADAFERNPQAGVVYGDRLHIDARNNVVGISRCPNYYPKMFRRNITLPQECTFFRREALAAAGGMDASLAFSMDFDLWVRLAKVTRLVHIPAIVGYFREHQVAKSVLFLDRSSEEGQKYLREHQQVFRRLFNRGVPGIFRSRIYRLLHQARIAWGRKSAAYWQEVRRLRELACRET